MKSAVLLLEGVLSAPRDDLDGQTPLAVARCPTLSRLATEGRCGFLSARRRRVKSVNPEHVLAAACGLDADVAPKSGRGPLEAFSAGVDWGGFTHAFCGEFITLDRHVVRDGRVGRMSFQETERLTVAVQQRFDPKRIRLIARAPGRLVVLARLEQREPEPGIAPWLVENDETYDPSSAGQPHCEVLERSYEVLSRHEINEVRLDLGENPANAVWLWGGGPLARLPPPILRLGFFSNSAMAEGMARALNGSFHSLSDPWGAKSPSEVVDAGELRSWIGEIDRLVVYVEPPAHYFRLAGNEMVHLLERLDVVLVQPLVSVLVRLKQKRVLLATVDTVAGGSDGRAITAPLALWGTGVEADAVRHFDEEACRSGALSACAPADLTALLMGE